MFRNAVVIAGEEKMKDLLTKTKEAYRIASIISALVVGAGGVNLVLGYLHHPVSGFNAKKNQSIDLTSKSHTLSTGCENSTL